MNILLLGKSGQVGWELQRSLLALGNVIALDRMSAESPMGLCGDLTDLAGLTRTVRTVKPSLIVNAAAYTNVDEAEREVELARVVNALAPGVLAEEAKRHNALFVHFSTDYVFDGEGETARNEDAATGPLNVYGHSKREGELNIEATGGAHIILRTSWVYGARGGNFAKTMLRLAQERARLTVIDDQWGAPTGADLLADLTAHAARSVLQDREQAEPLTGIFNAVAAGETTWYDYARHVISRAQELSPALPIIAREIDPVPMSAFPTPAKRPRNSRLDCTKLRTTFGLQLPQWQVGVDRMLTEIL